jgi:hypothetical protein
MIMKSDFSRAVANILRCSRRASPLARKGEQNFGMAALGKMKNWNNGILASGS